MVTQVKIVSTAIIRSSVETAIAAAVNEVADHAHELALKNVPVRKVFAFGRTPRTGLRVGGRQETRPLSIEEAQAESGIRGRLGLPSAFPQTPSGRRSQGSQPLVQTALFPGNYRSTNRANDSRSMERRLTANIGGRNRLVSLQQTEVLNKRTGHIVTVTVPVINPEAESDLSARGRYELKRQRKSAIVRQKGGDRTLGGALRKTVQDGLMLAKPGGRLIKATITAGDEEVTYAKYVEFGTRRSRAQPFLRPALALAREELYGTVLDHLKAIGQE